MAPTGRGVRCGRDRRGVDQRHHGLPQHTGSECDSSIRDDRPVRDQKGATAGVKERLR